jgi:hypothetical protein
MTTMTTMISTAIALPYELARLPLALVDRNLSDRLPEGSRPRVVLDRAIGSADQIAGALLHNDDITARGAERLERSDKLATAARLEEEAEERRRQARETAAAGRREATRKRKLARDRAASGLADADADEARGKQEAAARAEQAAAGKKAAAARRAALRKATIEQRKGQVDAAVEATKRSAQRKPKAELDEARETKQSAAEARADAQRLSELTEVKKQQRRQG